MHNLKYILKIKTQIKYLLLILIATDTMYVVIHHSNEGVLMLPVLHTTLYTHSEYIDTTL